MKAYDYSKLMIMLLTYVVVAMFTFLLLEHILCTTCLCQVISSLDVDGFTHTWGFLFTHKEIGLVFVLKYLKGSYLDYWLIGYEGKLFISYLRLKWGSRKPLLISSSIFSLLIGDLLGYMVYDCDLIYQVFIGQGVDGRRPS